QSVQPQLGGVQRRGGRHLASPPSTGSPRNGFGDTHSRFRGHASFRTRPRRVIVAGVSHGRDNLAVALLVGLLVTPASAAADDGAALHAGLVAAARRDPAAPGIAATVIAPGVRWSGAVGHVRRGGSARLEPTTPFRIASNTKTFTAAAVLRLAE